MAPFSQALRHSLTARGAAGARAPLGHVAAPRSATVATVPWRRLLLPLHACSSARRNPRCLCSRSCRRMAPSSPAAASVARSGGGSPPPPGVPRPRHQVICSFDSLLLYSAPNTSLFFIRVPELDLRRTFVSTFLGLHLVGPALHVWLVTISGASCAIARLILGLHCGQWRQTICLLGWPR